MAVYRKRLILILYVISFTASLFIFLNVMNRVAVNLEYSSFRQYATDEDTIYFVQNQHGKGYIFKINSLGKVKELFSSGSLSDTRILAISTCSGDVYIVLQTTVGKLNTVTQTIDNVQGYRIMCLDNGLNIQKQTAAFTVDEGLILTGFSAEELGLYMTFVAGDGASVKVFSVDPANLMDYSEDASVEANQSIRIESIRAKNAEDGRFYAEALYSHGQLYLRTDKDIPTGIFAIDPVLLQIVSRIKLDFAQTLSIYSVYLIWYVAALAVWFIVLSLIIRIISNRNRSFYYILIAETVLFIVVGVATFSIASSYQYARELEHTRFAQSSLAGLAQAAGLYDDVSYDDIFFYDTDEYQEIRKNLCEFVKREGNYEVFYTVMVVRLKDNLICASSTGKNQQALEDLYGSKFTGLRDKLIKGQSYAKVDFSLEGQSYRAVAIGNKALSPDFALVGIINIRSEDPSVVSDNTGAFVLFAFVFAIASAAVVLVWHLHMRDLVALEEALNDTAIGNKVTQRPPTLGSDVKDMWDALFEIQKRVEDVRYSKLRIMEAYYRFAPKNIEVILGKNSIIEVHNGDSRVFDGTIGFLKIRSEYSKRQNMLRGTICAIGDYISNHEAMIIGKDVDISSLQLVISDKEEHVIRSILEVYIRHTTGVEAPVISMFFYRTTFTFGVVGDDEESALYLSYDYYKDKEQLANIVAFVEAMQLGIVISGWVQERDPYEGALRFIGYGGVVEAGIEIKLFEVLDDHGQKEREEKLATLDKFNKALQLYLDKDFYSARNMFSEILRETPSDKLVRWYVFESERYLHESSEGNEYKYLHL